MAGARDTIEGAAFGRGAINKLTKLRNDSDSDDLIIVNIDELLSWERLTEESGLPGWAS
jgi:hypothetical protein